MMIGDREYKKIRCKADIGDLILIKPSFNRLFHKNSQYKNGDIYKVTRIFTNDAIVEKNNKELIISDDLYVVLKKKVKIDFGYGDDK
jgi:hypothetical protein